MKPSFLGFTTAVENELRRYDFHLDINIGADTRVAAAEIENLRRAARENATFRVDANTATAAAEIEALRRAAQQNMTLRPDIDRNAANRARGDAERTAAQIRRDLDKALGGLQNAATINLKVLGVVGAAGAIADLAAIGAEAAKAARAVALLTPAIGFGGLAGVGAIATGFNGIPAAFKAAAAASKDATADVTAQRDALNSVADAEFRVRQSQASLADAYRDSGRAIRDMNSGLVDQKLATQDAALSVQEAAQRLQKVQFDPTADATQRARAKLSYDQAVQRLSEQQTKTQDLQADTAEANAKGVEGSKQVTAARQTEVEAIQALAKAQEAAAKGSSSQAKLDDALAKLSPNARQLVDDVRAIGPAWTDARKASQDALTAGMGPAITTLANTQLPNLRNGLVGINTAINSGLRGSIAALSSDTNKADFKTALDNTATGFANAAKGAAPLTNALTKLTTVGSEFLPGFGTGIDNLATRFDNLIQRTAADGSLKQWMREGLDSARELAEIVGHLGSSVSSVFKAAGDDGATLRRLEELTDRMAKFLKSTEGQEDLKEFFAEARANLDKVKPLLADLPDILKGVYAGFQTWSAIAMPFLQAAGSLLAAHPGLVRDIVTAYLAFKTIGPIFDLVKASIISANTTLGNFRSGLTGASGASGAVSGLGRLLGAAGPLGVAALTVGAGAGLIYLMNRHNDAARAAEDQQRKEQALRDTLDKGSGKVTQETIDTAGRELQDAGFFTRAKSFGIDPKTFVRASLGLADADQSAINAQLTQTITESLGRDERFSGQTGTQKRFSTAGLTDKDIAQALAGVPEAVKKYSDAIKTYNEALPANQSKLALPDLTALKGELDDVGESAATLAGKMNGYSTVTGELGTKTRELNAATTDQAKLTDQAKQKFDALGIAVQQVPKQGEIIIKSTTDEQKRKLEELGYTVEKLPDGDVKLTANTDQAKADITAVVTASYTAKVAITYEEATASGQWRAPMVIPQPRAFGGPIEGGTPGRDSVHILGMPGEHMLTVADVNKMGGQAGVYRFRAALQSGKVRRMADGGAVESLAAYAKSLDGQPYGGDLDCSGFISKLANVAVGYAPNQGRMSTANEGEWLSALGFQSGSGVPGSFRVGWINDPNMPAGGHTAGTLPNNTNVESGGATGKVMYGGQAIGYGASMFNQHAYLAMNGGTSSGFGGLANSTNVTGESTLYPQAALPGRATDSQLQVLQGKAAVDSANSERNAVYANPASTDQDRLAADIKYQQAQNGLESAQKQGGSDTSALSLQGIFSKAGGIIAGGILSGLGLENSIFSESNVYNKSFNSVLDFYGNKTGQSGGYSYTPQNLPSIATSSTPQSSTTVNDPSLATQIPSAGPVTGAAAIDPNLGTINVTVPGAGHAGGAGVEQWRPLALAALQREGFSAAQVDIMLAQIQSESGGNPSIVQQVQDVNSGGNEAVGLLQVTPGTFLQYRDPSLPNDRTNPASNMVAALRYYRSRYGTDLSTMWGQGHGYDQGGIARGIGLMMKQTLRPERVLSPRQTETFDSALPLLESINASVWNPARIDPSNIATPNQAPARSGPDLSTTVNARVANVNDLADLVERQAQMKAIGLSAALP
ncbi:transglycosylase SLT domain-containing protein [Nocardia vinacea]|uniref:Transglycosylase SLT domain-containing protein n=1 Tax=Nocardia vinacea TaxID=96468 RepID=A0ABZ1Z0Y7_9NOCA|nr:transglycosylase SLT domain-containing protein [Nocardia vinacea]